MYRFLITINIILLSFNSFPENDSAAMPYRIIAIDSTENFHIIFISPNLNDSIFLMPLPFLLKDDECNHYSFKNSEINFLYCLLSYKINDGNRNIFIGKTYDLSLNFINYDTISATMGYEYIGYGDYILSSTNIQFCDTKEIIGLKYTQNSDSIKYFSLFLNEKRCFDANMLNIWMNIDNTHTLCYSQWLQKHINNSKDIYICQDNRFIVLYKDAKCKIRLENTRDMDYLQNKILRGKLFYLNKKKGFVQISDGTYSIYGWINNVQKVNIVFQTKQTVPFLD